MAINEGNDPTRGTGPEKVTEVRPADPEAADSPAEGASGPSAPAAARGGCLKLGWGCLPVLLGFLLIPAGLFL